MGKRLSLHFDIISQKWKSIAFVRMALITWAARIGPGELPAHVADHARAHGLDVLTVTMPCLESI